MIRGVLLAVAIGTLAGCGSRAEQPILAEFFHASRLRDRTALQKLATTSFDPAAQGMITNFEITAVAVRKNGDLATKDVSIAAPVRLLNGQLVHKRLVVTMELRDRRWIVSAVTESPASAPSTPPS